MTWTAHAAANIAMPSNHGQGLAAECVQAATGQLLLLAHSVGLLRSDDRFASEPDMLRG